MPYKLNRLQGTPESVWEYERQHSTTDDDLILITFENGERLYVAWREQPEVNHRVAWRIDEYLMPENLSNIRLLNSLMHERLSTGFKVAKESGYVGQNLWLDMETVSNEPAPLSFYTDSPIARISQVSRPNAVPCTELSGKM